MKAISGTFTGPDGTPLEGAVLRLTLSQDATVLGTGQIAPRAVSFTLGDSGELPTGSQVWGNDELSPAGTCYSAVLRDEDNKTNVYGPELWPIEGASPVQLSDIVPPLRPVNGTLCTFRS